MSSRRRSGHVLRTRAWAKDFFAGCLTIQQAVLFCPLLSIRTQRSCGAPARTRIYPCLPTRAATSSMKTVLAFTTASLAAFEERSSAAPTLTRGGIMATGRLGFSTGFASLQGFSALRFAIMP